MFMQAGTQTDEEGSSVTLNFPAALVQRVLSHGRIRWIALSATRWLGPLSTALGQVVPPDVAERSSDVATIGMVEYD